MASRFSYAEIAAAAVLVLASYLAGHAAAAHLLPASLLTPSTAEAAATLRQVAVEHGLLDPDTPDAPLPSLTAAASPTNPIPAVAAAPAPILA